MYYLTDICCICLSTSVKLFHFSTVGKDNITYRVKILLLIPQMNFKEINVSKKICKTCCDILDLIYSFRSKCVINQFLLENYILKLRIVGQLPGKFTVCLNNIGPEIAKHIAYAESTSEYKTAEENQEDSESDSNEASDVSSDFDEMEINIDQDLINLEQRPPSVPLERFELFESFINGNTTENHGESIEFNLSKNEDDVQESAEVKQEYDQNSKENQNTIHQKHMNQTYNNENKHGFSQTNVPSSVQNEPEGTYIHPRQKFKCSECKRCFKYQKSLRMHKRTHTDEKNIFNCDICGKKFKKAHLVDRHKMVHQTERPYECDKCTRKYKSVYSFERHKRDHVLKENLYMCEICNKLCHNAKTLVKHLRAHIGYKSHECSICHKKFHQKIHLTRHMEIHNKETPYECNMCHRKFKVFDYLRRHMRIHKMAFDCGLCKQVFYDLPSLSRHKRSHTEQIYRCPICSECFELLNTFTVHVQNHNENKPFDSNNSN